MKKINDVQRAPDNLEAITYRKQRLEQLEQDPRVLSFLSRKNLDIETIEEHFPFFDRWLLFLDRDKSVESLQIEGFEYQLFFEGDFFFQYVKTPAQQYKEETSKFLRHILINQIPLSMRYLNYQKDVARDEQDSDFLTAYLELGKYIKNPQKQGFYLYGGVGSGKTYLMSAMINELARQGHRVGFINMVRFLQDLKNSFNDNEQFTQLMNRAKTVDVLTIDDVGAEVVTDWSLRVLIELLDARMNANLSTHFTSNLDFDQLIHYYTRSQTSMDEINAKRIFDRIRYLAQPLRLNRASQRTR